MVFDYARILNGIFIIIYISFFFIFNLDFLFFLSLVILIFYDLYKANIFKNFLFFKFLLLSVITSILIYFLHSSLLLQFISIFLFVLFSLFVNLNFKNIFLILILILFLNLLFFSIDFNRDLIFMTIYLSFINDSCAYLFGNLIKGPKILPSISPKKTWSGTSISVIISSFVFIYLGYNFLFSILISLMFFLGDIFFSYIKRLNKLKDFSNLIPGHGGVLDRLDSIIFPFILILIYDYYIL